MRITKQALVSRWRLASLAALAVFAVLAWSDSVLKARSGFGTADLQTFSTASQYGEAFRVWPSRYAARAGFNWGLDYLLMPLYAAAFFYSGILARESLALRGSRLARILTTLSAVPVAGAALDAVENALQFHMLLNGPTDLMASVAFTLSRAKWMALIVGLGLAAGALFGQGMERARKPRKTGA